MHLLVSFLLGYMLNLSFLSVRTEPRLTVPLNFWQECCSRYRFRIRLPNALFTVRQLVLAGRPPRPRDRV